MLLIMLSVLSLAQLFCHINFQMKEESVFSKGLLPGFLLYNKYIFKWIKAANQSHTSL